MKIYVIIQIYYIVDFVLVDPWFFFDKGVFHVNPYVIYSSFLISQFELIFYQGLSWGIFIPNMSMIVKYK